MTDTAVSRDDTPPSFNQRPDYLNRWLKQEFKPQVTAVIERSLTIDAQSSQLASSRITAPNRMSTLQSTIYALPSGSSMSSSSGTVGAARVRNSCSHGANTQLRSHGPNRKKQQGPWFAMADHPMFSVYQILYQTISQHSAEDWLCCFAEACFAVGAMPRLLPLQQLEHIFKAVVEKKMTRYGLDVSLTPGDLMQRLHLLLHCWAASMRYFPSSLQAIQDWYESAQPGTQTKLADCALPVHLEILNKLLASLAARFLALTPKREVHMKPNRKEHAAICAYCRQALEANAALYISSSHHKKGSSSVQLTGARRRKEMETRLQSDTGSRWPDLLLKEIQRNKTSLGSMSSMKPKGSSPTHKFLVRSKQLLGHGDNLDRLQEPVAGAQTPLFSFQDSLAPDVFICKPQSSALHQLESLRLELNEPGTKHRQQIVKVHNSRPRMVRFLPSTTNPYATLKYSSKPVAPGAYFAVAVGFEARSIGSFCVEVHILAETPQGLPLSRVSAAAKFHNF